MVDNTQAQEDQSQTTSMEAAQPQQQNTETDFRKLYYQGLGKTKALERTVSDLSEKIDKFVSTHQSYNEEQEAINELVTLGHEPDEARKLVAANRILNKKKANAHMSDSNYGRQPNLPNDLERDTFLQKYPEAYQFIDELDRVKELTPSRKYEDLAYSMRYINPPQEEIKTFSTSGAASSSPTLPPADKLTPEQEEAAYNAEVDKLLGRNR